MSLFAAVLGCLLLGGDPCEPGWAFDGGIRCTKISLDNGPWGDFVCEKMKTGSVLYAMEYGTQESIGGFAGTYPQLWVGMRETSRTRKNWEWETGGPVRSSAWAPPRPFSMNGDNYCGFMSGSAASDCRYPTPQYPAGDGPYLCDADCSSQFLSLCSYKPAPPTYACNDTTWTVYPPSSPAVALCYKVVSQASVWGSGICSDFAAGGYPAAKLASLLDDQEMQFAKTLIQRYPEVWVSAEYKGTPNDPLSWEWTSSNPPTTYVPKWMGNRQNQPEIGSCAIVAGTGDQLNSTTNCTATTGDLCNARCDSNLKAVCQYPADTMAKPWPPEEYLAPITPPTPTPTFSFTPTKSITEPPTPSATSTLTLTISYSGTATLSMSREPTRTEIPWEEDVHLWILLIIIPVVCIVLMCLLCFIRKRRNKEWDSAGMREMNEKLDLHEEEDPIEQVSDSDPEDSTSFGSEPKGDYYQQAEELPEGGDSSSVQSIDLRSSFTFNRTSCVAPDYREPIRRQPSFPEEWESRIVNLTSRYPVSRAQAIKALHDNSGHAGLAARELAAIQHLDRYEV
eukprot:TRINITY_DN817_c0_g3_i1.p1 TRINITY_DN817_c0_g3~~TRINITY_DN817_c0_g3_i1.p1  ORF type:complete len:565 (+),score=79.75 TRINITY_DN817_c0_g3_i1:56-1750(+)